MSDLPLETGSARSWSVPGLPGVECFRAQAIRHSYGWHSHPDYSIGVIEAGVGGNDYRGAVRYLPPGSIVVMNPQEAHTGFAAAGQPLSYRMLYVSPEVFRELFPGQTGLPFFRGTAMNADSWAGQIRYLHRALEASSDTLEQQTRLAMTLTGFAEAYSETSGVEAAQPEPYLVSRVKDYLQANFQRNVSIDELVQLTHWSRAYLIRAFHRRVGLPPYRYLLQLRIEHAKQLLAQGQAIAQVANEVGFADQSHLTRCFKNLVGATPKQYAQGHYHSRRAPKP